MTQGFDEWYSTNSWDIENYYDAENGYKAGAASRQAEVDSLKIELNGANERAAMTLNHKNKMVDKMQAEIDELQKRVDKIASIMENAKISRSGNYLIGEIDNVLKGESNDQTRN